MLYYNAYNQFLKCSYISSNFQNWNLTRIGTSSHGDALFTMHHHLTKPNNDIHEDSLSSLALWSPNVHLTFPPAKKGQHINFSTVSGYQISIPPLSQD